MSIGSYDHVIDQKFEKELRFNVERSNVGDRLKRVLAKFQANRSHPQRVNRPSKFAKISKNISSKNETSGIVRNVFWQSLRLIGAKFDVKVCSRWFGPPFHLLQAVVDGT